MRFLPKLLLLLASFIAAYLTTISATAGGTVTRPIGVTANSPALITVTTHTPAPTYAYVLVGILWAVFLGLSITFAVRWWLATRDHL